MARREILKQARRLGLDPKSFSSVDLENEVDRLLALEAEGSKSENVEAQKDDHSNDDLDNKTVSEAKKDALKETKQVVPDPEPEKKTPTFWKDANGDKWAFTKRASKTLNWGGVTRTQAEVLSNNGIMEQLTTGNYNFIKRIK